jgi:hypothetical protein
MQGGAKMRAVAAAWREYFGDAQMAQEGVGE